MSDALLNRTEFGRFMARSIEAAEAEETASEEAAKAPITVATTTLTLLDTHHNRVLLFTHASGCVITVPDDIALGTSCLAIQRGAATVSVEGGGSMTIVPEAMWLPQTFGVGSAMAIVVESATVTNVFGDLEEA